MPPKGKRGRTRVVIDTNVLVAGGYPWTVIPVGERTAYMHALEKASVGEDIGPFADFLAGLVKKGLAGEPLPEVPRNSSYREKRSAAGRICARIVQG